MSVELSRQVKFNVVFTPTAFRNESPRLFDSFASKEAAIDFCQAYSHIIGALHIEKVETITTQEGRYV